MKASVQKNYEYHLFLDFRQIFEKAFSRETFAPNIMDNLI